jgi:antitoxin (DNA-binding transcriptional repressor) of toxin-antitoxin stability system
MRELRNHTREVIERAQTEAVTITDDGVPVAVLTALSTASGGWNVDAWLDHIVGPDWEPYDSGLAADVESARRAANAEPDAVERLGLR